MAERHSLGRAQSDIHPDVTSCAAQGVVLVQKLYLNTVLPLLQVDSPLHNHLEELGIDFFFYFQEKKGGGMVLFLQVAGYEMVCELALNSIKIGKYHLEDVRFLMTLKPRSSRKHPSLFPGRGTYETLVNR